MAQDKYSLIYNKVKEILEKDRLFLNPDLSLKMLSRIVGTNTVYLSKAINEGFHCNFHTLMNQYRVSYVIEEALNSGDNLEEIAKKYGFWSRSSFYGVFHDYTGMTPRRYTEEILKHRNK